MRLLPSAPTAPPAAPDIREDAAWTTLAELSADMLALLDSRGRILWVNEAFIRATGWQSHEVVGQALAELIGFAGVSGAWNTIAQSLSQGASIDRVELPWKHPLGETRWGGLAARQLPSAAGFGARLAVSLQDLTEHHRLAELLEIAHSQSEVKTSPDGVPEGTVGVMVDDTETCEPAQSFNDTSEQLRLAVDLGSIAIWRHDLRSDRLHYNYRACQILDIAPRPEGFSLDEVRSLIHPDDIPRVIAAAETALKSDRPVDMEARYRRPDGSWRHVLTRRVLHRDSEGTPLEFVGVALDVTDRVRTEDALRSANERVALTARSVGLGTWEWQPVNDQSTWDDQMYRLRGLQPADVPPNATGRREVVHPEDRDRVDKLLSDAVRHGRPAAYEFRVVWPDGSVHWLASRSIPVTGAGGTHYIGVNWDITDAVNAERARREKFIAQRESEAKSQFLARMSHELRTPLNAVLGFAQLLQLDGAENLEEQRARIDHILSAGEHLLSLINDVLDLSSLESGQLKLDMQPVPVRDLAAEVLPLVTPLANSFGVTLHSSRLEGVAWGDRIRLRQVLINLLSNAIKYNHPGGSASVQARVVDGQVCLSVSDTGRGITLDQRSHLFEPFNRLGIENEGIEGTSIGLAIVKTLVTRMGGSIDVHSEPGNGSRFEVKLQPADQGKSAPPQSSDTGASTAQRVAAARLLYIEDNPINVMLMEELVASRQGWSIACEVNGERGVARAVEMQPDVILVDMQLPDFDGFEVLRRLRAAPQTANIPCIAVSANAMADDIARALAAGFAEYWTKPISFAAFLSSLELRLASSASRSFTSA